MEGRKEPVYHWATSAQAAQLRVRMNKGGFPTTIRWWRWCSKPRRRWTSYITRCSPGRWMGRDSSHVTTTP